MFEEELILDIGSGPGNVTTDILIPSLKGFKKVVGLDCSKEMVEYSNQHYGKDNVQFQLFNIEEDDVTSFMKNKFHRVFSFYCLHWVLNHR